MKRVTLITLMVSCAACQAAGTALYDTGPEQDAAFVRFVNATPQRLEVVSGKARLPLPTERPVSEYQPVKPDTTVAGSFEGGAKAGKVSVKTAPSTFATILALPGTGGQGILTAVVSESPDDFNALKSSIAFYNLDAACKNAGLQTAGKAVPLFKDVADRTVQRRLVNPVSLAVQPTCEGKPRGIPVDLGALQPGQRYSLLLVPLAAGTARLIFTVDSIAR